MLDKVLNKLLPYRVWHMTEREARRAQLLDLPTAIAVILALFAIGALLLWVFLGWVG